MQQIGDAIKNNTYKNKNGVEKQHDISVIPNNMEKYMAFSIGRHLRFIDSFQFMSSSLENLVSNITKCGKCSGECQNPEYNNLKYSAYEFEYEKLRLMAKKGIYPYGYMDSFKKFNEKLPTKDDFYSILNNKHITDEEYKHAQNKYVEYILSQKYGRLP